MRLVHVCSTVAVIAMVCCASSHAALLYDGSLGNHPTDQNWFYITDPLPIQYNGPGASATQSLGGGATILDTTPVETDSAGYFSMFPNVHLPHPGIGTLMNSSVGFSLLFTMKLHSESHSDTDRAGFSIIVLDSAQRGVELAFWTDEIWAQIDGAPLFTHPTDDVDEIDEKVAFTTPTELTEYQLDFHGSTYSLSTGGNPLIEGDLKDYTAHGYFPYQIPSFIFFGDDTSSASAEVSISRIELIPEPATATILLVGLAAGLVRRKHRAV